MNNLNLQHLRTFVAVVEAGTFSKASVRLHLSQPAITRQIDGLEHDLGIALFEKVGRRSELTADGRYLLQHAHRVLTEVNGFVEEARLLNSGETGLLRIGASSQFIEFFLAGFLSKFRAGFPRADFQLVEAGGLKLRQLLKQGELDIIILPEEGNGLPSSPLYPICNVAVLAQDHPLTSRKRVNITDLKDQPVLLLNRDFVLREKFDAACRLARISPHIQYESSSSHTIVAMAKSGHGIGIIPSLTDLTADGVCLSPLVHNSVPIGLVAVAAWNPEHAPLRIGREFVRELAKSLKINYPGSRMLKGLPGLPRH